jgi:cellulose synthase/poly-beta-1,6-N-acetylglucosamine synthase-like glycosyltransferase
MVFLLISCVLFLSAYVLFFAIVGLLTSVSAKTNAAESLETAKTRFLVFVPAHDEGEYLRPTLRSLRALDYPPDHFQIVVIADNCTDDTAVIAEQEGCAVWRRTVPDLRGKGHALTWAFQQVAALPFDAVVVVDADTLASSNLLRAFDRDAHRGYEAMQARDNLQFPADAPPWLRLISRATKNAEDRYVTGPRSRLRLYQGLQGTGFCLSTQILRKAPWRANSICEDLEYGLELARQGVPVHFVEDASVSAAMTGQVKHASGQRQRWAGGTYALITKSLPGFFLRAFSKRDWRSLELCAYLVTLSRIPLFLLTIFSGILLVIERHSVSYLWWILYGSAVLLQTIYVLAILSTNRKESSLGRMVAGLFVYLFWISYQHLSALLNLRHARWNRTERG